MGGGDSKICFSFRHCPTFFQTFLTAPWRNIHENLWSILFQTGIQILSEPVFIQHRFVKGSPASKAGGELT